MSKNARWKTIVAINGDDLSEKAEEVRRTMEQGYNVKIVDFLASETRDEFIENLKPLLTAELLEKHKLTVECTGLEVTVLNCHKCFS